jgi:CheY-like chemotaxis protein
MVHDSEAKILLVDDKPANLLALRAVLESRSYSLVEAGSGAQALALIETTEFAAILLDIQMPGMDGYETARRIKSLPLGKDVPIVFITAVYKEDEDVQRGYEAGALDFFAKPFMPRVLKTKVGLYADLFLKTRRIEEQSQLLRELSRAARPGIL